MHLGALPNSAVQSHNGPSAVASDKSRNKSQHLSKFLAIIVGTGATLMAAGALGLVGVPVSVMVAGGLALGVGLAGMVCLVHKIAQKILNSGLGANTKVEPNLEPELEAVLKQKNDFSAKFTERLLKTLEPISKTIIDTMQERSNHIFAHVNSSKENASDLNHILKNVNSELDGISKEMSKLKRIGQGLKNEFAENQITAEDFETCQSVLQAVTEQLIKASESIVYFIENSLVDERTVFFTAWPDQEAGRIDIEPPINTIIERDLNLANKMFSDCEGFLEALKKGDSNALASVILGYSRIQQIVKRNREILNNEVSGLPGQSHQGKINELKEAIQNFLIENQKNQEKLNLLTNPANSNEREEISRCKAAISRNNASIKTKEQFIRKYEDKKKAYNLGLLELEKFENKLLEFENLLKVEEIIGENGQPLGKLTLKLANPVIGGIYTIKAEEFTELADNYSYDYIDGLKSLEKKTRETMVVFSELNRKLEESVLKLQQSSE